MKVLRSIAIMASMLAALPVTMAAEPSDAGRQKAAASVQQAAEGLTAALSGLLDRIPAEARAGIERAIEASRRGHATAMSALGGSGRPAEAPATEDERPEQTGKPDVTGVEKAFEAVTSAFEKSVGALARAAETVPEDVRVKIEEALAKVESHRAVALENLTLLIGAERPSRGASERPERPDRPERLERPERPERPELPERPEPPARPEVPDRPERP
ncbi:MAG: hypothetical protein ACE5JH_12405 [Acidobacteriota bacterium]